jgi:hypothetical protein
MSASTSPLTTRTVLLGRYRELCSRRSRSSRVSAIRRPRGTRSPDTGRDARGKRWRKASGSASGRGRPWPMSISLRMTSRSRSASSAGRVAPNTASARTSRATSRCSRGMIDVIDRPVKGGVRVHVAAVALHVRRRSPGSLTFPRALEQHVLEVVRQAGAEAFVLVDAARLDPGLNRYHGAAEWSGLTTAIKTVVERRAVETCSSANNGWRRQFRFGVKAHDRFVIMEVFPENQLVS